MKYRRIITALLALAAAVAVTTGWAAAAASPAAQMPGTTGHIQGPPGAARACTDTGQQSYTLFSGAPSAITAWFTSNPCGHLQSPELKDNGGGYHYGDSWRSAIGVKSTASSSNAADNSSARMWVRWRQTTTSQIWCFRVWPAVGTSWFKASHSPKCD